MYDDEDEYTDDRIPGKSIITELAWPIAAGIIALSVFGGFFVNNYTSTMKRLKSIEKGLEECPIAPGSNTFVTFWTSDCAKYLENYNKYIKDDK